ncbi:MAG: glycine cleavage system protein R [Verrucomicrobiae bacterium]|nr:glycine cleavage system protein R [Verrucomicrobiae bacterium]
MISGLSTLVMTVIGPDRPGLVEILAEPVSRHRGNWLESRMAHLAGEFAGILTIEVPTSSLESLRQDLAALAAHGLQITVQSEAGENPDLGELRQLVTFHLVGQDRPGIVASVSRVLASNGANVEELVTGCKCAPMTGETLFEAEATVSVPDSEAISALRGALELIAADLMVDVTFEGL